MEIISEKTKQKKNKHPPPNQTKQQIEKKQTFNERHTDKKKSNIICLEAKTLE